MKQTTTITLNLTPGELFDLYDSISRREEDLLKRLTVEWSETLSDRISSCNRLGKLLGAAYLEATEA